MKKKETVFLGLLLIRSLLSAQMGIPYVIKNSVEFESPRGYTVLPPIGYGKEGVIQVSVRGVETYSFQKFSTDLILEKENTVSIKEKITKYSTYDRITRTKNKSYLFVQSINKEQRREGINALEFFPDRLDFAQKSVSLFESSGTLKIPQHTDSETAPVEDINANMRYTFILSEDKTKFMYSYTLTSKEKKDKLNKDVVGLYVFDENLNKIWGGEYQMPYTEAMMNNLGYTLSNDGKIYLLVKVFSNEDRIASIKKKGADYHYEVLVYQKDNSSAKAIEIKLDNYFSQEAYIYEDRNHNIVIAGFYSKLANTSIDGAYMVKLEVDKQTVSRLNGGTYEIPIDVIKSYSSDREKRRLDKQEKNGENIGIYDLKIRSIATTPNGSIKIVAEQYQTTQYFDYTRTPGYVNYGMVYYMNRLNSRTVYSTQANDIFVFSIDLRGQLEWVKKVPKSQHGNDGFADGLSLACSFTENNVNLFYLDNTKNINLPEDQSPYIHEENSGGYFAAVRINKLGAISKYNLGDNKNYKTNFFIRYFIEGGNNNLISTERKNNKNMLFSIEAL